MQESVQNILTTIDYKAAFCTLQTMYGLTSKQSEAYLNGIFENNGSAFEHISKRTSKFSEKWC